MPKDSQKYIFDFGKAAEMTSQGIITIDENFENPIFCEDGEIVAYLAFVGGLIDG